MNLIFRFDHSICERQFAHSELPFSELAIVLRPRRTIDPIDIDG
jgi:hypothetical protein